MTQSTPTPTSTPGRCPACGSEIPQGAPQGLCPKCLLAGVAATEPELNDTGSNSRPVPPPMEKIAAAFPNLEILELIGQGGMGFVWKSRQPNLDRLVALKLLPAHLASRPGFRERFTREARTLARLNHPAIVAIHDFGEARTGDGENESFFYLLMEFVEGVNLRQAMRAGGFTPEQALSIIPKICEALAYAHGEGVLHRDIKPENILLDRRGRVKIADFGIAKIAGDASAGPSEPLTATGAPLGTPQYMAPEQIERPSEVDHRADIYSLGVVFYEMLTGELPLGRFAAPSEKTRLDPRVDDVVLRALEKERERRQQSAGEVKTQVETITSTPAQQCNDSGEAAHWSVKGIVSAVLAFPVWLLTLVAAMRFLAGDPSTSWAELIALPIAGGTLGVVAAVLGLMALTNIRKNGGKVPGARLAAFGVAATTAVLTTGALVFLSFLVITPLIEPSTKKGIAALVGVSLAIWHAVALYRWGAGQITSDGPRSLAIATTTVIALIAICALPLGLLIPMHRNYSAREQKRVSSETQSSRISKGLIANATIPAGQVAIFEIVRRENNQLEPIPEAAAYTLAPTEQKSDVTFRWVPKAGNQRSSGTPLWEAQIETPNGTSSTAGIHVPPALAKAMASAELALELKPNNEYIEWLRHRGTGQTPWGVRIRTESHGLSSEEFDRARTFETGTTEWKSKLEGKVL